MAACSDWVVFDWRVSARALETALWRASFSGFGGMGGGGPEGVKEGKSISNGEVSRSGVSGLGSGWGAGAGCGGCGCGNWCWSGGRGACVGCWYCGW